MEIRKLNTEYTPDVPDAILDIVSLQFNSGGTSLALLRDAQLHSGKNGLYLSLSIQDGANRLIPGYYFQDDAQEIYTQFEKYRGSIAGITYDVNCVHDKKTLNVSYIDFNTAEISDTIKEVFFHLTDSKMEENLQKIYSLIDSVAGEKSELLRVVQNNSKIINYLKGYTADYMRGEFGSHAELTKNIFNGIASLHESILDKEAKLDAFLTYLFVESSLYAERQKDYNHYDLVRVAKFLAKLEESLAGSVLELNPITVNGYFTSRIGAVADNTVAGATLYKIFTAYDSILRLDNELSSLSIKKSSKIVGGERIFI